MRMSTNLPGGGWKVIAAVSLVGIAFFTMAAVVTRIWVLSAVPIGFLFGYFLEKSDLCGASALSEVILMKDGRKLGGIAIVVVSSMQGFALLAALNLVQLNPKPFIWANILVGGAAFGIGIVLAGGCVSGVLFKTGQGNLNSMAALVGVPLGASAAAYGPLAGMNGRLKQYVLTASDGSAATLSTIMTVPYWALAIVFAAFTVAIWLRLRKSRKSTTVGTSVAPLIERVMTRPWRPWHSGIAIGLLATVAYLSSAASGRNYPLGTTDGVLGAQILVTDHPVDSVWQSNPQPSPSKTTEGGKPVAAEESGKKVLWWLVLLVFTLVIGAHASARMRGSFRLAPKPPDEMLAAFIGGLMVGAGAFIAGGCMVGHVMSGFALMSLGSLLFGVVVLIFNWATTWIYLRGGLQKG